MSKNESCEANSKSKFNISGSTLKIIALLSMTMDHIGIVYGNIRLPQFNALIKWLLNFANLNTILTTEDIKQIPQIHSFIQEISSQAGSVSFGIYICLRLIGRIAFPIFAFLIVEGFLHTRDVKKYAIKLLILAIVSEIPFNLVFVDELCFMEYQNVLFTLCIGLITIALISKLENKIPYAIGLTIISCVITTVIRADYSIMGIILMVVLYMLRNDRKAQVVGGVVVTINEVVSALAFIPIYFYNGKRGLKIKYFFYLYYPCHLLVIYFALHGIL